MKRLALKVTNYVAYLTAIDVLSSAWGKLFSYLFKGFLEDEAFAEAHPCKYLLGVLGIFTFAFLTAMAVIWYPLSKLMKFIDSKIDDFADDKEWD